MSKLFDRLFSVADFTGLALRWLFSWLLAAIVVVVIEGGFSQAAVSLFTKFAGYPSLATLDRLGLVLVLFLAIEALALVAAAIFDLSLRVRHRAHLFQRLWNWALVSPAFEQFAQRLETGYTIALGLPVLVVIVLAVIAGLGYLAYILFGALAFIPTSLAILIAALIVASALSKSRT